MGATVEVRGEGGDVFDMDVPDEGTVQREVFDSMVSKGLLTVLSDPEGALTVEDDELEAPPAAEPQDGEPESEELDGGDGVPAGTIAEVSAWVRGSADADDPADGWDERARQALAAEQASDSPRSTFVAQLEALLAPPAAEPPQDGG